MMDTETYDLEAGPELGAAAAAAGRRRGHRGAYHNRPAKAGGCCLGLAFVLVLGAVIGGAIFLLAPSRSEQNHRETPGTGSPAPAETGLVGIRNFGTTCYMNAVLQALVQTPGVDATCERVQNAGHAPLRAQRICQFLAEYRARAEGTATKPIRPTDLRDVGCIGVGRHRGQEDSRECLTTMLDVLAVDGGAPLIEVGHAPLTERVPLEQLRMADGRPASQLDDYGRSLLARASPSFEKPVGVLVVGADGVRQAAEMDGDDPLPSQTQVVMLSDPSPAYVEQTIREEVQEKALLGHRSVAIQLGRFQGSLVIRDGGAVQIQRKNNHPVTYPARINTDYGDYELYTVVQHRGSVNGGHYVASVKAPVAGRGWHLINDSRIRPETEAEALGHRRDAYLLFYRRAA